MHSTPLFFLVDNDLVILSKGTQNPLCAKALCLYQATHHQSTQKMLTQLGLPALDNLSLFLVPLLPNETDLPLDQIPTSESMRQFLLNQSPYLIANPFVQSLSL